MATLENKTILVIGGTSGIGYGVAEAAVKSLAQAVIVASSNKKRVEKAVERLTSAKLGPGSIRGHVVDGESENSLKTLFEEVGEVDHVVVTSGRLHGGVPVHEIDINAAKGMMDLSVWSALAVAKHAKFRPKGSLTLTTGTFALKPSPTYSVTAVAGGSVHSLTKALAVDLAPIRVNNICAGAVITELWDKLPEALREGMFQTITPKLLVQSLGVPNEIAEAYLFCMKCNQLTGQSIVVDGGLLLGS